MNYPNLAEATAYLQEHIPLSDAMGVSLRHLGTDRVEVAAPLAPNINHRQTVFGGSIYSVAVLSAWAYLHFRLRAEFSVPCRVVISQSAMQYSSPVDDDFRAVCPAPLETDWQKLLAALRRHQKGRIGLTVSVCTGTHAETPLALFTGTFVAVSINSE